MSLEAEELRLPFTEIALVSCTVFTRGVDRGDQPRTHCRGRQLAESGVCSSKRIESACLRQALEHPLVEEPQVELLAQCVQGRNAPMLSAHLQQ